MGGFVSSTADCESTYAARTILTLGQLLAGKSRQLFCRRDSEDTAEPRLPPRRTKNLRRRVVNINHMIRLRFPHASQACYRRQKRRLRGFAYDGDLAAMCLPTDYGTAGDMLTVALSSFIGSIIAVDVPFPFAEDLDSLSRTARFHFIALVGPKKVSGSNGNCNERVCDPIRHCY